MNEYQKYIEEVYNWALKSRRAYNWADFAKLVGVNKTTLSLIINGKKSGKTTAKRIKHWMDTSSSTGLAPELANAIEEGYNKALRDMDSFNWLAFRREAAKDILVALCTTMPINMEQDVRHAINIADELIKQLKK